MSDKDSKSSLENGKQSVGTDSKNCKRNSGLFSFFKWLKPSGSASRESLNSDKTNISSSCDSLSSVQSSGTVASFSFVEPSAYSKNLTHKKIPQSPETDTYRARIKQRDQRREKDKNLTLRKKYNLFFSRDTILKNVSNNEESTKSLPLMTKPAKKEESKEEGFHRRTNSDSSKVKKAGAYVHVKGKRKAPQPPGNTEDNSNASLKKNTKRLAPPPPATDTNKSESTSNLAKEKTTSIKIEGILVTAYEEEEKEVKRYSNQRSETEVSTRGEKILKVQVETAENNTDISHKKTTTNNLFDTQQKYSPIETTLEGFQYDQFKVENNHNKELEAKKDEPVSSSDPNFISSGTSDIISNDSLKLDHGILKPVKDEEQNIYSECSPFSSRDPTDDSKPWYKRHELSSNLKREFFRSSHENKYEPIEILPEVSFNRNSTIDLCPKQKEIKKEDKVEKKKEDKRKSGLSLLANISELDREAAEILQKEKMKNESDNFQEMPEFMKPKEESNTDSWVSPKRRSARDLIAKFNAITNVTKATVNTAFFGSTQKRDYFGKSSSKEMKKKQEALLESHKKRLEMIDNKINNEKKSAIGPLMKSESASIIKKPDTPKSERKSWNCPKCYIENEYWRIICHVCSAIKPYFDDLSASPNLKKSDKFFKNKDTNQNQYERILERSKTQIGFTALSNLNSGKGKKRDPNTSSSPSENTVSYDKKEEREKLKKMLIEMKNSLPKKTYSTKQPQKQEMISEKPEMEVKMIEVKKTPTLNESSDTDNEEVGDSPSETTCTQVQEEKKEENVEEKVASILIGTKETIYENIKVKRTSDPKPVKVSSSVQTTSVISKPPEPSKRVNITTMVKKKNSFEPMKAQDFEDIYSDKNGNSAARIYANLAQNDELSLFFNMPKNLTEMKNTLSKMKLQNRNKDTIEINRLLRKLEVAIAKGDLTQASDFAKELAQLRVNCSVIRQKSGSEEKEIEKNGFSVDIYVEDKVSHRGPFPFQVRSEQTVGELKKQVEKEFEIPVNVQRWILGKELATDDKATLKDNNITEGCPIFLYLVAPELPTNTASEKNADSNEPTTSFQKLEKGEVSNSREEKLEKKNEPRLYPNLNISSEIEGSRQKTPKIINAIPKAPEVLENQSKTMHSDMSEPSTSSQHSSQRVEKTEDLDLQKPEKHFFNEVVTQTVTTVLFAPDVGKPEELEEYDVKTLRPNRTPEEWECHLCTLLNPTNSNVCGVCATVRQIPLKNTNGNSSNTQVPVPVDPSTYLQLMNLDNEDIVHNAEGFECVVCFSEVPPNEGVTLRECLHQFCKQCLRQTIEFSEEAEIRCPYRDNHYSCNIALQDREIKALVPKTVYDQHLAKSVTQAENKIDKSFHCKTPDCKGWCIFEDNVNEFRCPVCRRVNCLTCQAIHMGLNCKQYQQRMTEEAESDENAKQTREMLDKMVKNGEALKCPTCHVIMMKKWGCDWLRCSMCKTEICWVTRGPRWGPGGKGDTSGGCQCGVNGVKCHPKCNYCH